MMRGKASRSILCAMLLFVPGHAWQDDLTINLRHPLEQFAVGDGVRFFNQALAEVRLGPYLKASENHFWRGGAMGDVSLVQVNQLLWHMGLAMETLADDQNDISFRLVQVYYQALTGLAWNLGSGALQVGYRHRCSHGADHAVSSRITIKSGLITSYHWVTKLKQVDLNVEPGINWYMVGQNSDHDNQPKGNAFLALKAQWPLRDPLHLVMASGISLEIVGQGYNTLYGPFDALNNLRVEPLFSGRLALRVQQKAMKSDFALHFSQNIDSALTKRTTKSTSLLFAIDFLW